MPPALSALSITTPSALWALTSLLIPVLIHLFNRSRGRVVHIGHIELIRQARRMQVTELKLSHWLLLLLRLGIFALAALILADLARPGLNTIKEPAVYLSNDWLETSGTVDFGGVLNHMDRAPETRVFRLQEGFEELDRQFLESFSREENRSSRRSSQTTSQPPHKIWPLLAERLSLQHHDGPVDVYTTDLAREYGAFRPDLPRTVNWHISQPQPPAAIKQSALLAAIVYDPDRIEAAALFEAAMTSLRQHRLPNLKWTMETTENADLSKSELDWLIVLSDYPLDPGLIEQTGKPMVILTDANGGEPGQTMQFLELPFYPFSGFNLQRYETTAANDDSQRRQVLLMTTDGLPLLQISHRGSARRVHFSSRFDADWSSVALQPEFPEILLQLLLNADIQSQRYPDARISHAQLQSANDTPATGIPLPSRSIKHLLVLLLILLWVSERWLSERKHHATG